MKESIKSIKSAKSIKSIKTIKSTNSNSNKTDDKLINKELNGNKLAKKKSIGKELTSKLNSTINSNNNSINLNDQQSKNKSINNQKIISFEDKFVLKLDWNSKVKLIKLLDEYTKLLVCNEKISNDKIELMAKDKADLINLLTQSPFKLDKEYEIFINLDNKLKLQIIDQLIKNENLINYCKDKNDSNLKNELINCNNSLNTKLINLPLEFINNGTDDLIDKKVNTNQSEFKDKKLINQLKTEVSNLQIHSISLEEELNKLKSKLDDTIVDSKSITLYCLKKDIKKFFEIDTRFFSKPIEFLNIKWYILIKSKYVNQYKKKYLNFYLQADNEIDDGNNVKWKCETSYELILKSNKEDKIRQLDYTFEKTEAYGLSNFIDEDELFKNDNIYIKDDAIQLKIKLRVNRIERNI